MAYNWRSVWFRKLLTFIEDEVIYELGAMVDLVCAVLADCPLVAVAVSGCLAIGTAIPFAGFWDFPQFRFYRCTDYAPFYPNALRIEFSSEKF